MKVVINDCHGGFSLSNDAFEKLLDLKDIAWEKKIDGGFTYHYRAGYMDINRYYLSQYKITENRADPSLVTVVEELGFIANGEHSELKIVEIPDDIKWHIEEYDGNEWVAEDHRTWS